MREILNQCKTPEGGNDGGGKKEENPEGRGRGMKREASFPHQF